MEKTAAGSAAEVEGSWQIWEVLNLGQLLVFLGPIGRPKPGAGLERVVLSQNIWEPRCLGQIVCPGPSC